MSMFERVSLQGMEEAGMPRLLRSTEFDFLLDSFHLTSLAHNIRSITRGYRRVERA